MKFIIYRSSTWTDENPNVEGTIETPVHLIDRCYHKHQLEQFSKNHTDIKQVRVGKWEGTNTTPQRRWVIEFNTIEELLAFVDKYSKVIVHKGDFLLRNKEGYREIEIYDDYRE